MAAAAGSDAAQPERAPDAPDSRELHGVLMRGWFSEVNSQWPGVAMSFKVDEVLHDAKSEYQHVQVFRTPALGNVLVLDGVIQCTEKDECAYQEMIAHLPMFAHPNPRDVLVVGGGDGGVIREVLRHPSVERVVICEIDQMVIDVSKRFLPGVAREWGNPKVSLHRGDAAEFVKRPENRARFDVIVCDSSDPVGPAEALFEAPFFRDMADALRPGGCLSTQGEGIWMHLDLIAALRRKVRPLFAAVEYATTQIPTYPCGQIGFLICAKAPAPGAPALALSQPARAPSPATQAALRYYSPALHRAAFVLPEFARRAIYADEAPAPAAT